MAGLRESASDRQDTLSSAAGTSVAGRRARSGVRAGARDAVVRRDEHSLPVRPAAHVAAAGGGPLPPARWRWTRRCRRGIWRGRGSSGARRRTSSTPRRSPRWNACWRRGRISNGRTTAWRRSACTSAGSRKRASPTSRPSASNPKTRTGNLEYFYIYSGDFARAEEAAGGLVPGAPRQSVRVTHAS